MQSNRSIGRRIALPAITFILGVGCASAVYWLFIVPGNSENLVDALKPSSSIASNPGTQEQGLPTEVSSSSEPQKFSIRSLDDIEGIKSTSEQQLALRTFLSDLDESRVAELLTQSQHIFPKTDEYEVRSAIVQRLAHHNPSRALSLVLEMDAGDDSDGFVTSVFKDWVHSNLDEAVSRARTLNRRHARIATDVIVQERTDLSDETVRAIARDLGLERIAMSAVAQRKIVEAIDDPETAWNELVVGFQDDTSLLNEFILVASAWVEEGGISVLDSISQSLTNAETRQRVLRSVLRDVAHSDPAGAFLYAQNIESDPNNAVVIAVAGVWARSDPGAALLASTEIKDVSLRKDTTGMVISAWARREPKEVLKNVNALPFDLQEKASIAAISAMSRESPEGAARLVATMESGSIKTESARSVARNWSDRDHSSALDWILNDPGVEEIRSELLSSIMHRLVKVDPDLAMRTALDQPIEENVRGFGMFGVGVGMETNVISSLAFSDMDKAIELLPLVREGRTSYFAFQIVASSLVSNDEIDKAFDTAQQFPDRLRKNYYSALATAWAGRDPKGLFNSIDRFPSKDAKSRVALLLVTRDQISSGLTDEQVDEARKYLTDEHARVLGEADFDALRSIFLEY